MAEEDFDEGHFKRLIRLHAPLKGKITSLKKYLQKPLEEQIRGELIEKYESLKGIRDKFEEIQTKIEQIVTDNQFEIEQRERENFEEELCFTLARIKSHIHNDQSALLSVQSTSSVNSPTHYNADNLSIQAHLDSNTSSHQMSNSQNGGINQSENANSLQNQASRLNISPSGSDSNYRIPRADLPKFEGSYEKWPGFSDTFKSAIHNSNKFSDSEKLLYLRSCLQGKAAEKIESLETTAANYQVAWSILEKYYDDPAAIINNRIRALFELPSCQNASNMGELLDNATKHYRALEVLNKPFLEAFPIYLLVSKLDHQSRLKWKEETQGNSSPSMNELLDFLHSRRKILETYKPNKIEKSDQHDNNNKGRKSYTKNEHHNTHSYATQYKSFCHLCKGSHFTYRCEQLTNANPSERANIVKKAQLCFNCLRSNHRVEECKSVLCKVCNKKHHTLLHVETDNRDKPSTITPNMCVNSTQSTHMNTFYSKNFQQTENLLTSTLVQIMDRNGIYRNCRLLLDSCSQPHLLTARTVLELGLQKSNIDVPLGAINSLSARINHTTRTTVKSRLNNFSLNLEFLIVDEINESLPSRQINTSDLKIPKDIELADPSFDTPGPIDGIIGSEYFLRLLRNGQIKVPGYNVILQNTVFGWIIAGKTYAANPSKQTSCHLVTMSLSKQVEKFWTIENVPETKMLSIEENECESHYEKHTTRDLESGRYCVKLPFRENVSEIGESYSSALKRLHSLERSFIKRPEIKTPYIENLRNFITSGYMSEAKSPSTAEGYYLPHHAVVKDTSLTTQLRVVFDGSAKSATGLSLNDVLMVGPTIQDDLFSLLVRFRTHAYVLTADIEKMYLRTIVHPDDRKYQKILWREDSSQPVKTYELNTATFGTSAAPFLAIRSLHQLANDEENSYSKAVKVLRRDFYVDDMLTGASTIEEAKQLRDELIKVTRKGGLNLRKWASNDSSLIKSLSECSNQPFLHLNLDITTKTLGIHWNAKRDLIVFTVNQPNEKEKSILTKREILSQIAQLFDPLGLFGPITVHGKILMQKMWILKIGWDTPVPSEIYTAWKEYHNQLPLLSNFQIKRKLLINNYSTLQLHGFSDASEKAYGASIYIRSLSRQGKCETHLVCSKSRVAPIKSLTLPRLELSAALLLARLYEATAKAVSHLNFDKTIFWSDSTITLH